MRLAEDKLAEQAVRGLDQGVGTGRDFIKDKQAVLTEEAERATMHRERKGETR